MVQALSETLTFEEFLDWYPDGQGRYELIDGVVSEMTPTGDHEEVGAFIARKLNVEIDRLEQPWFIPRTYIVRPPVLASGYQPDVLVVDRLALDQEPLWKKSSVITRGASIKLAIEVVSTNWRDDYGRKLFDYEAMGIGEYWIVDFRALGARRFTGYPKQPTLSLCQLVEGEYQIQLLQGDQLIISQVFPELTLTAAQVFQAGLNQA
ncbi:Uma2 family endonuclease [Leptolyngbya sp. CCNP1308]|uniref:Uma2 family endonuclease n=1 Tax=Leptolyngbya sp. CCNP1308 TaxID=3110255 RepID=UPI002B204783|nr:Uma2 family endonuclease [Leptolyngbya sp. CCNP1308]MEA5448869.1 Uma2 family endonuclease [Leptolyngbya sp. CCNP1308]